MSQEEPEQAADRTARSVLLLLWGEREEFCINLRYLARSHGAATSNGAACEACCFLRVPQLGPACTFFTQSAWCGLACVDMKAEKTQLLILSIA